MSKPSQKKVWNKRHARVGREIDIDIERLSITKPDTTDTTPTAHSTRQSEYSESLDSGLEEGQLSRRQRNRREKKRVEKKVREERRVEEERKKKERKGTKKEQGDRRTRNNTRHWKVGIRRP